MRGSVLLLALGSMLAFQSAVPLQACGDKLLMLGRGIRFQSRHTPRAAAVLLYLPATTRGLTDPKIESALTEAGHTVRSVATKEEMAEALRGGQYEVVLADLADAAELQQTLTTAGTSPVIVPAVYLLAPAGDRQVKSDAAAAAKAFGMVLQVPGRPGHYCALVDKAMELKLKREREQSKAPRS